MSTTFVSRDIWPQVTEATRYSRGRCDVAVAYFGVGASHLLPLPRDSHLVVDASERAVSSGQTCPADLLTLAIWGVAIYSVANLHAKVFVLGRSAYIGSTNVSSRSAAQLVEAAIRTTESDAIHAARKFVHDHCLHELAPTLLKRLSKLYRSPKIPGGERGKTLKQGASRTTFPRVLLVQLELQKWSERDQRLHDSGLALARKRRQRPRGFQLDSFRWPFTRPAFMHGDLVVQVVGDENGRDLVSPPDNVLHVATRRDPNGRVVSFVYVERPSRSRRQLKSLARALGCPQSMLHNEGVIRTRAFARALLKAWAVA